VLAAVSQHRAGEAQLMFFGLGILSHSISPIFLLDDSPHDDATVFLWRRKLIFPTVLGRR
jgi:hypothetical protein